MFGKKFIVKGIRLTKDPFRLRWAFSEDRNSLLRVKPLADNRWSLGFDTNIMPTRFGFKLVHLFSKRLFLRLLHVPRLIKFGLRFYFLTCGFVKPSQTPMNRRVFGAEPLSCFKFPDSVILASLVFVDNAQVEMGDGNRRSNPNSVLEEWHCLVGMMEPHLGITKIG
jgi:hypothetical protein